MGLDDPNDVKRLDDGTWQIKAGARVQVNLTMAAQTRRYHVALVDPLPAGLEPINPSLSVSDSAMPTPKRIQGEQNGREEGGIAL